MNLFRYILAIVILASSCAVGICQENKLNESEWKDATKGVEYLEEGREKKEGTEDDSGKSKYDDLKEGEKRSERTNRSSSGSGGSFNIPTGVSYILIGIVLLLLAYAIVNMIVKNPKVKNTSTNSSLSEEKLKEIEENPFENDLEKFIYEALQSENYRLAIRLQFIYILRLLSENGLVNWKKHKTNYQYSYELSSNSFRPKYDKLNKIYEGIWFGEFSMENELMLKATSEFATQVEHLKSLKSKQ